jgi:dTDP-4-dehydrorhamnose 3,5-epimerase
VMEFEPTGVSDARLIRLTRHLDSRGEFARTWCASEFERAGITFRPVQANMSLTRTSGTIRGMHFQRAPKAEAKLVRCSRGRIWDVITDLRPQSTSYLVSFGLELADEDATALYVPAGFAHGFQALTEGVTVEYLMEEQYVPDLADGFRYDDPSAKIAWPLPARLLSEKDLAWPALSTRPIWLSPDDPLKLRSEPTAAT